METALTSNVDSALTPLAAAGVNASHLNGVSVEVNQGFVVTTYDFRVPVPSGEFAATRDKMIAVQRNLANSQSQFFAWNSVQVPTDEQLASALEQAMPALMERAKQRANILALAMNSSLGPVIQLSTPAVSPDGPTVTVSLTATYSVAPVQ